jgi:hypothetical protein
MSHLPLPHVPVSWGELLDKLTILEIKLQRIADGAARANVGRELVELSALADGASRMPEVVSLVRALKAVNEELWDIEEDIRAEEARGMFGREFIRLARSVYQRNDARAALKRELNLLLGSELIEEKSYWSAPAVPSGEADPRRQESAVQLH